MSLFAGPVQDLIDELGRLPGVGPKSAQRITFHLLKSPKEECLRLAGVLVELTEKVVICSTCFNVSDSESCHICSDASRDPHMICVVEEPRDVVAIERTGEFKGRYHVLQGVISPIDGIGPDQVRIRELIERVKEYGVTETIVATNPNLEGETTAMYISRVLAPLGVRVTRIASGLPVGGDLDYADEITLGRALQGRRQLDA